MLKIILSVLMVFCLSFNVYPEEADKSDIYKEQWKTVQSLQRLLDNGFVKEALYFFSTKQKERIKKMIDLDPNFFLQAWKLDEFRLKRYKDSIFKGNGIFVFEDGEWKIDEI